jgi:hypothetical protein
MTRQGYPRGDAQAVVEQARIDQAVIDLAVIDQARIEQAPFKLNRRRASSEHRALGG